MAADSIKVTFFDIGRLFLALPTPPFLEEILSPERASYIIFLPEGVKISLAAFLFPVFILLTYIFLRVIFAPCVLMIEKKGPISSIRLSWKITKRKVLSLLTASIFIGLIILLLGWIELLIKLFAEPIKPLWARISKIIIYAFGGVLFPLCYHNLKREEKFIYG